MAAPERRVGPYLVLERLGAGGMGEVFLARDTRLERDVALKLLPAEFARDVERMSLFRSEALALVLERVEGVTLGERLRAGAMPQQEALRVCAQIAEALEAAHARGVI
ncbi:MAG TPA: serine/threonine protein kinase, partial [Candidatus Eisenbacteria bacterium]|nr:serine/threonine protein kinase [Candidatus Eisenbacteria bacterium]